MAPLLSPTPSPTPPQKVSQTLSQTLSPLPRRTSPVFCEAFRRREWGLASQKRVEAEAS